LWNSFSTYVVEKAPEFAFKAAIAAAVLVAFYIVARLVARGARKALLKAERGELLSDLVAMSIKYAIVAFGGVMALDQLGIDITTVLAGAGVVGLAVGFGAQNLVKDTINGF